MTQPFGEGSVEVSDLTEDDLGAVTALHIAAFPQSELSRLGDEAVWRHYRWQLRGPHDLTALAARTDGELVGFLLGGVFRGSTAGFVKSEKWFLAGQVLRHPTLVFRGNGRRILVLAGRMLARPRRAVPEAPWRVPTHSFGVLVVAVDPTAQRLGIGASLLTTAEQRARDLGFERMHLTVRQGDVEAQAFYSRLGWRRLDVAGDDASQRLIGKELVGQRD